MRPSAAASRHLSSGACCGSLPCGAAAGGGAARRGPTPPEGPRILAVSWSRPPCLAPAPQLINLEWRARGCAGWLMIFIGTCRLLLHTSLTVSDISGPDTGLCLHMTQGERGGSTSTRCALCFSFSLSSLLPSPPPPSLPCSKELLYCKIFIFLPE